MNDGGPILLIAVSHAIGCTISICSSAIMDPVIYVKFGIQAQIRVVFIQEVRLRAADQTDVGPDRNGHPPSS